VIVLSLWQVMLVAWLRSNRAFFRDLSVTMAIVWTALSINPSSPIDLADFFLFWIWTYSIAAIGVIWHEGSVPWWTFPNHLAPVRQFVHKTPIFAYCWFGIPPIYLFFGSIIYAILNDTFD
jgi:hypothetical protein